MVLVVLVVVVVVVAAVIIVALVIAVIVKGKAVPLQAWSGPGGSMKLSFPDFVTTA